MNQVFISGSQRSGTTLLENVLNSHPDFYITHELNWVHMLNQINGSLFHPRHVARKVLAFNGNYIPIFDLLYSGSTTKSLKFIGDKLPDYTSYFGLLNKYFPDAKHLFCFRNPLDIINSMISRVYDAKIGLDKGWDKDLSVEEMCIRFNQSFENYNIFKERFPNKVHLVKYELLTSSPEKELLMLSEYLDCDHGFKSPIIKPGKKSREHITKSFEMIIRKNINEDLLTDDA